MITSDLIFLGASALVVVIAFQVITALYAHPLAKYPGPLLWRVSRIPYAIAQGSGLLCHKLRDFHRRYGDVVRVAPNELSYTDPLVIQDIYGRQLVDGTGMTVSFQQDPNRLPPNGPQEPAVILSAKEEDHKRLRKAWAPSFSTRALSLQEPIVISYINELVQRLDEQLTSGVSSIDLERWIGHCTFDIIGALSFGQDFACMRHDKCHAWAANISTSIKALVQISICRFWPLLWRMVSLVATTSEVQRALRNHHAFVEDHVKQRLAPSRPGLTRSDFLDPLAANNMTLAEISQNIEIFVIAGSHTTQTTIVGLLYLLLNNPSCLVRAAKEVRAMFCAEEDINARELAELRYFQAVIREASRLTFAVPINKNRVVHSPGAVVRGDFLPGGTLIGYDYWAAQTSPKYFHEPLRFAPERWLGGKEPSNPFAEDRRDIVQPFITGSRDCLGQNLAKMVAHIVARLLYRYDMSLLETSASRRLKSWYDMKAFDVWEKYPLKVELRKASG